MPEMAEMVRAPARRGRTRLAGGRMLGWSEWGPEDGSPVLFCPGAATSSVLGFGGEVVDSMGVRLIGLDRPGLGASDPAAGRTLGDWAEDVRSFVGERGLRRPRIVGFSQGAPFALACTAAGVASGAAIVSGTDELAAPHLAGALVPDVRGLVANVERDPDGTEAFFRTMSAAVLREMILTSSSDVDRAVYLDPVFDRAFSRALDEGFAQGAAGYARDTVLATSRWPFEPARISVPVDLWYGARDASAFHSPDRGASLAGRIPTARRTVLPDAGGALLWTHAGEILRALLARVA